MELGSTRQRPLFGGHEKFAFRHGWLKKGFDALLDNPLIFCQEDAFIKLGVGKNMANSIRYWGLALGIYQSADGNPRALQPSQLGNALLGDNGWDPYLEDIGSLWLLHWQLASNQERGLVWYLAFSRYYDVEFRKPTLIDFLKMQLNQRGMETTEGMIEREFDVFVHTYIPAQGRKGDGEENLDCPLVDLNLLNLAPGDGMYRFNIGGKLSLPAHIFGYSLLVFLTEKTARQRTVTLDECVYSPGSPGQIFKLDENSVAAYIDDLETLTGGALQLHETAGLHQIYLHATTHGMSWELLNAYYA
jgi:hypothetical protein